MYQIDVVTIFPQMFRDFNDYGVIGRAITSGLIDFRTWDPRDLTKDKYKKVDDRPYGGGPGMVMMYEPLRSAIIKAKSKQKNAKVIYMSPQGRKLEQQVVCDLASRDGIILVAGRYEGIDERIVENEIDEELSIGDYVISGGELAAMVVVDSVCRRLPEVLGNKCSVHEDSFVEGLLDFPHYTRPEQINGFKVPNVLLEGHHEQIRRWRLKKALGKTWLFRPDLIKSIVLDGEQELLLEEFINELKLKPKQTD